ncbi:MAG: J domain-containing protein [Streptosporangiaceae bacterium]|nr:J domain-containing protein [Streptosporangiaceae bacterium]
MTGDNPFEALGLQARADLTDDDVRAAWRRIAAVTHPDRPDGGDASRFAAAAAAYALLRTGYGRGEAYADLLGVPAGVVPDGSAVAAVKPAAKARLLWRVRRGRPAILALRVLIAGAVSWASVAAAGWQPATLAIAVGSLTWLLRTTRYDLAPPLV